MLWYIETIRTPAKVVICFKANSKLCGIPTTDFTITCNSQLAQIEKSHHHIFKFFIWFDDHIQQFYMRKI